ncbi:signal peptidase II [Acholeplasma vituli]|uniref:Lipoprotein signal peptidase n=1 Tax=Paracholeplasma vituli TaxID=69473 RepID=A0ABT2PWI3_9MOLU|nr:signal peptidase II [Paracholeplasma vituli]MCU0105200.1 signal peptidase II [Paracholeplasma vituli]
MFATIVFVAILFAVDQILKIYFSTNYGLNETETVFAGFLNIGYIRNYGVAFGMFSGMKWTIVLIGLVMSILISTVLVKSKQVYIRVALGLVLAGATGNLFDRLSVGYVIDYLQMPILPVVGSTIFNISDVYIIVGCAIILFFEVRNKPNSKNDMPVQF